MDAPITYSRSSQAAKGLHGLNVNVLHFPAVLVFAPFTVTNKSRKISLCLLTGAPEERYKKKKQVRPKGYY